MLKIQEIREIIKLIDQSSIEKFSYEVDGAKIKLEKGGTGQAVSQVVPTTTVQPVAAVKEPTATIVEEQSTAQTEVTAPQSAEEVAHDPSLHEVVSPMVGTFYAAPSPEAGPFVQIGTKVTNDSVVCIVEAMKLFNEIEAEVSGEIVEILAKDGQLVEFGQPLFLVKTN